MITKSYIRRCLTVLPAVPICALGVVLFLKANWGSDPLTMFELGLSTTLGWSFGTAAATLEGAIFVIFFFINRKLINFGSFAFAFGIGPCVDLMTPYVNQFFPAQSSLGLNIFYLLSGGLLICFALASYIPVDLGYQTSDILTLSVSEWFHLRYGYSLTIVYATYFILALSLGAPWGIGTIVAILGFGPVIDWMMTYTKPVSRRIAGMDPVAA